MEAEDILAAEDEQWSPVEQWQAIEILGTLKRCKDELFDGEEDFAIIERLSSLCEQKIADEDIPALLEYPDIAAWVFAAGRSYAADEEYEDVLFDLFEGIDAADLLRWYIHDRGLTETPVAERYCLQLSSAMSLFTKFADMWGVIEERLRNIHATIDTYKPAGAATVGKFQEVFLECMRMDEDMQPPDTLPF